jgi:hypothetical protein
MNTIPTIQDYWIPKTPGARHPDDSVAIHSATVSVALQGGGFIREIPLDYFLANFRRVEDYEKKPDYRLAFFSFDEGPTILGWTAGNRWNGWGCPLLERSCIERYIALLPWEQVTFDGDNLVYYDENCDPDEQAEAIRPQVIHAEGRDFQVYAFGGFGLCWNQTDPENAGDDLECTEAILPPGITNPITA